MKHSNYDDCNVLTTPGGEGEPSDQLMISDHLIITDHHPDLKPPALHQVVLISLSPSCPDFPSNIQTFPFRLRAIQQSLRCWCRSLSHSLPVNPLTHLPMSDHDGFLNSPGKEAGMLSKTVLHSYSSMSSPQVPVVRSA